MKKENKELTAEETVEEKKATKTAFILMFPALIVAGFAVFFAPIEASFIVVLLVIYQFLMLKQFIVDFYKNR